MPLYEYSCTSCGHNFDSMRKIDQRMDPEKEPCPECKEQGVKYHISTPNIVYSSQGSMKTTDSFNDRLKEIKNKVPERFKSKLNDNIR